ncbi:MAG: hypothetical protein PVF47_04485 [Anaerolineae bacterium]|jgi:hypothetical protein
MTALEARMERLLEISRDLAATTSLKQLLQKSAISSRPETECHHPPLDLDKREGAAR